MLPVLLNTSNFKLNEKISSKLSNENIEIDSYFINNIAINDNSAYKGLEMNKKIEKINSLTKLIKCHYLDLDMNSEKGILISNDVVHLNLVDILSMQILAKCESSLSQQYQNKFVYM